MIKNLGGMIKLGLILAVFAAATCVLLAFVYAGTSTIIAERQQADLQAALKELFPNADSFDKANNIKSPDSSVVIESAYSALKNGEKIGAALNVSRTSYGGPMKIMVGVSADGIITGVKILEHSDTPGLGANAASPSYFVNRSKGITFYGQFAGKKVTDSFAVKKGGVGDVDVITASTITSVAVSAAVKAAGIGVTAWFAGEELDAVSGASEGGDQ